MPSEHLRNVRISWIFYGWFTAAALASFAAFVLDRIGLLSLPAGGAILGVAVMLSFLVGGFFTGYGVDAAPDFHGIGIAVVSVLVWIVAALIGRIFVPGFGAFDSPLQPVVLLVIQGAAAVLGARLGVRFRRR